MSFTGTLDKCKVCDKTVYFMDLLTVDGIPYHKTCFRCNHCKGNLQMSNYSSMDGILYCKPHFEQLFKESGNFNKNFQSAVAAQKEKHGDAAKVPSKFSSIFCGTQDKCFTCKKTVYPLEKISLEGESYHKTCFRCAVGGCALTHSSYAALDGVLYCRHHFGQLFMEKGNYKHILEAARHKKGVEGEHSETPPEPVAEDQPVVDPPSTEEPAPETEEGEGEGGEGEGEEKTEEES